MSIQSNYTIVQFTNYFEVCWDEGGMYKRRDCIVRTEDGALHLWGIREDLIPDSL